MRYIVATGVAAALVVLVVNWGEVLLFQLLIRSVLVGIGFILALTAAKKAVATFVLASGSPVPGSSDSNANREEPRPGPPPEDSVDEDGMEVPDHAGAESDQASASEEGEEMDPGRIAEMISGQMSGDEG